MKKFEFRLQRVMELRQQQSEIEQARLRNLKAAKDRLEAQIAAAANQREEAMRFVKTCPAPLGSDFAALAAYERHAKRSLINLDAQKEKLRQEFLSQQQKVVEAERKVKLLEKLKAKRLAEWTAGRDKELEEVASESYISRLMAAKRKESADSDLPEWTQPPN